jgi:hypothetical protein
VRSRPDECYKIESFWSEDFSAQEWAVMMTEAFGPGGAG